MTGPPPPLPERPCGADAAGNKKPDNDVDGDTPMGATLTDPEHTLRHRVGPLPSIRDEKAGAGLHCHCCKTFRKQLEDAEVQKQTTLEKLQGDLDIALADKRSIAVELDSTVKLMKRKLESAEAEREDFRRRWKQSTKELRQATRPRQAVSQINDDDLSRWAKQLRIKIRNFAIRHFESNEHAVSDFYEAVEELRRARFYDLMEETTPGTSYFEAFLSSPTRRTTVIQAFMWRLLRFEVFNKFLWAGAASGTASRLHRHVEQELIMSTPQTNPEAQRRYKLWSVSTTGLLIDCAGGEGHERALEEVNDEVKNLVKDADGVMCAFLKPDIDERAYFSELEEIIRRAISMDRDIRGQAADVKWVAGDTTTPTLFREDTMALERGEKASAAMEDVVLVIAPALYKLGKSNGDDFDKPPQLLLPSEGLDTVLD